MTDTHASDSSGDGSTAVVDLLADIPVDSASPFSEDSQLAAGLARKLQQRANDLQTPQERRQQAELDRMIQNPHDKCTLTQLTDQAFRAATPNRAVDQLVHILDVQGIPRFFTPVDRVLLKGFQSFGSYLPGVAVPLVKDKMRHETANVILPAEQDLLTQHLRDRRHEGLRMNVNYLGEALLGEEEAQNRLRRYLQALQIPEIEVISVKISTIYSQISSLAHEHTVSVLCDRLELLLRAAAKSTFAREDGSVVPKFVYLDMEEYRDMQLTSQAFMRTLDRPGLKDVSAGMVLQSYIPDSYATQQQLLAWARGRVAEDGAPVTLRIVKGANMEMERFEASLAGWPQAPYKTKLETDANFRRMVQLGMQPDNLRAVRLGIASHNLFELAFGLVLACRQQAADKVQFEMLEGMANHQRRALFQVCHDLLLYAPACRKEDFIHAIGYLVRRLDENTGPDNFLRHAFRLDVGSPDWQRLERQFFAAFDEIATLAATPRRSQDRNQPPATSERPVLTTWERFSNEPDTDFALPQNVAWAEQLVKDWKDRHSDRAAEVPLVIDGDEVNTGPSKQESWDPSRPGVVVARYRQATADDIERAVASASRDEDGWRRTSADDRREVLRRVAEEIRAARAELMGAALADGGKILPESDPEVSEAVDFAEFYSLTAQYYEQLHGVAARPRGAIVVVSPWNFPIAIPCGGVAAALAAGNTVILKPASDTVLVAYLLCQCFWRGGVSRKVLQFVPCAGATQGQHLVAHQGVDTVILTGGTDTALAMLKHRPHTRLLAETGGKNATVVTALADRDQAIKNVVHSAFSHSGQKCSATSLLVLEDEVYQDANFKRTLCDAVSSRQVGSAWDLATDVGPLIRTPSGVLDSALKELEPGESWAVMPRNIAGNSQLYTPAVKWNVQPGSFTQKTEFFGPVLGVLRAKNLTEAIELVNSTGYGLTSGLESLDDREQEIWSSRIRAGNLYINRGTTGAIVLRQPFGGMGKSAFGPGIKAGGPNYVAQLMHFTPSGDPPVSDVLGDDSMTELLRRLKRALAADQPAQLTPPQLAEISTALHSYDYYQRTEFGQSHDHFLLIGQDNFRRYLPVQELRIRVDQRDSTFETVARICAAKTVGCRITVSHPHHAVAELIAWLDDATQSWAGAVEFVEESDDELARVMREAHTQRVRFAASDRVPDVIRCAAAETGLYVADATVQAHGRIELLWYVEEQSISHNYHRYGNLGERAGEPRQEPL